MSKKIILFLSSLNAARASETEYTCPDRSKVSGVQTNEAPVRYLLKKYPDVTDLICMVTKDAEKTALEHFWNAVQRPNLAFHKIPYEMADSFSNGPMQDILSLVKSGDEVLLETTGGFRNAIMHLMLLTRVLSYTGVKTNEAVYANYNTKQIEDISDIISMFELVNGMQELTSFGSVKALQKYYSTRKTDKSINSLLFTMDMLSNDISLCRTEKIEERMEAFSHALSSVAECEDPLMRQLLPVFREKFGEKPDILSLIAWCADSGMIQQALTIYKERLPRYILKDRPDLLVLSPKAPPVQKQEYQDEYESKLYRYVFSLAKEFRDITPRPKKWSENVHRNWNVATLENLDILLPSKYVEKGKHCPTDHLKCILQDYFYLRALRNTISHASDSVTENQIPLMEYLRDDYQYKSLESVKVTDVTTALSKAIRHLRTAGTKEWRR